MSQPNILHNFKSKNFDSRKYQIQFIVLHYTETKNLEKAIDLLTSKKKKSELSLCCRYQWSNLQFGFRV